MPTRGFAVSSQRVYVYDGALSQISVFDMSLVLQQRFGREGSGPGEFARLGGATRLSPNGPLVDWLAWARDTLFVLDGRRLQAFSADGKYLKEISGWANAALSAPPIHSSRMRSTAEGILLDIVQNNLGGYSRAGLSRRFTLWLVAGDSPQSVASIPLQPLPRFRRGGVYNGRTEAAPLWDVQRDCFVVSDGGSPFIWLGRLHKGIMDSVRVVLPDRAPRSSGEEEALLAQLGQKIRPPPPALPRRIRKLALAPDGWLWISPVQPNEVVRGEEVIRLDLLTGGQALDTVPFFPTAFVARAVYGTMSGDVGQYSLRRATLR